MHGIATDNFAAKKKEEVKFRPPPKPLNFPPFLICWEVLVLLAHAILGHNSPLKIQIILQQKRQFCAPPDSFAPPPPPPPILRGSIAASPLKIWVKMAQCLRTLFEHKTKKIDNYDHFQ